jgi:hypothetical protein
MIVYLIELAISIFWIFDVIDMPFMEIFDTTYPINSLAWILMWICIIFIGERHSKM